MNSRKALAWIRCSYVICTERYIYSKKEYAMDMAAANIRAIAEKQEMSEVYAIGAASNDAEKELCNEIGNRLKSVGIELIYGKSILYDAGSLENAAKIGASVVICAPGVSTYDEIADTVDKCQCQETRVLGLLMIG